MDYNPATRTRTLARIIGPALLLSSLAVVTRIGTLDLLFPAFFQDSPLVLVTGVFTAIVGFAMIAAHHHWTGAAAIVVSLLGVATAFRGAVLMLAPQIAAPLAAHVAANPVIAYVAAAITFLLGLWLTFVGWLAKA